MKKLITLACFFTLTLFTNSFSQSVLFIENGTSDPIDVILYSYDVATCNYNGFLTLTVTGGASVPVNSLAGSTASGSEWIVAEFNAAGCGSQLAVEADGLGGCLPCPSFGIPSGVLYNLCGVQPFKALWNTYCGSNNPHLHFYN